MFPSLLRPVHLRPFSALVYRAKQYRPYSSGSSIHDGDAELLETEKRRNLKKEQHLTSTPHEEGAPGWNEYLASSSEAHIKADKYGGTGPPTPEMTQKTLKRLKQRYGTSKNAVDSSSEAGYEKDEVEGPLKTSKTGQADEYEVKEVLFREKTMTRSEEDVKADRNEV